MARLISAIKSTFFILLATCGLLLVAFSGRWPAVLSWYEAQRVRFVFERSISDLEPRLKNVSLQWFEDVQKHAKDKKLKIDWGSIRSIEVSSYGELADGLRKSVVYPFGVNKAGRLHVDVFFSSWKDEKSEAVLVQLTFADIKTKNFVSEVANTYFVTGTAAAYDDEPTPGFVQFIKNQTQKSPAK